MQAMILPLLYCVIVYGGVYIGLVCGREGSIRSQFPVATVGLLALIGIPTVLQFAFPAILATLERNWPLILQGQVWRLLTSLLVQDGGWQGSLFNLTSLTLLGFTAEKLWGPSRLLVIFGLGGVITVALACWWQPVGAGNSVANIALAAATAVLALKLSRQMAVRCVAIVVLGAGLVLLIAKDVHGIADAVGAGLGYLLANYSGMSQRVRPDG